MTDEQIIAMLTCCANDENAGCSKVGEQSLELINRQKAEIGRLKQELDLSKAFHKEAVAERNLYLHQMAYHKNAYKTAQSEAIQEFAERLKEIYKDFDANVEVVYMPMLFKTIDSLVKEMTEEKE